MVPEQMWNAIAHIKQQFGLTFGGFSDFKQLTQVNGEPTGSRHSRVDKYAFGKQL